MPTERLARRPEVILGLLGVLAILVAVVRVNRVYSNLPAHPLFLHVPVILIPLVAVAALVLAARPAQFDRHGGWVTLLGTLALGALNLTMAAGGELEDDLHLSFASSPEALLVHRHAEAADKLRIAFVLFTAILILAFAVFRRAESFGFAPFDRPLELLRTPPVRLAMRGGLIVFALLSLYLVFKVGDLGAKAVWLHRG